MTVLFLSSNILPPDEEQFTAASLSFSMGNMQGLLHAGVEIVPAWCGTVVRVIQVDVLPAVYM